MKSKKIVRSLLLIVLSLMMVVMIAPTAHSKRSKRQPGTRSGNIYNEQYEEIGHWKRRNGEIVIYDDEYRVQGYISTKTGKMYDKEYRETGSVNDEDF